MSWKDHLTENERIELLEAQQHKIEAILTYNAIWRRLKARCDARKRRIAIKAEGNGKDNI